MTPCYDRPGARSESYPWRWWNRLSQSSRHRVGQRKFHRDRTRRFRGNKVAVQRYIVSKIW